MPFEETCRMERRVQMMADYDAGHWSVSELSARYGVSRETFYDWKRRRASGAVDWFMDRSHAVAVCPHRTADAVVERVRALRRRFGHMGPRKLRALLEREAPEVVWPAASTIGDILKRAGLIEAVRRRRKGLAQTQPFAAVAGPNDEWCADYKGWFRTGDGRRVDPLTLSDSHSRYLIAAEIAALSIAGAQEVFEAAFQAYGLPLAIRCDNGAPFGGAGPGGLTRLSAWWLRLGVRPHFITPASPQENGRHERMHRTLKAHTSRPPAENPAIQQKRFEAFRRHYNKERPHEALGQAPPAEHYRRSPRAMPRRLEDPWYDADHQVRIVNTKGEITWRGERLFVSEALEGQLLGLAELENGDHVVRFCDLDIGLLSRERIFRRFGPPRPGRPKANPNLPSQTVNHQPGP